ncbi:MAG TPA: hypothetical protein PKW90_27490, partial [Myxococcota bacterium]|nr:hypothetical protein [Myxococcota bacterium]
MKPHALLVLEACLERLELANRSWIEHARRHLDQLVANRLERAQEELVPMEEILGTIDEEDDVRLRATIDLALELGLPPEPLPRVELLVRHLDPEDGTVLAERCARLRTTIQEASELAKRVQG